MEDIKKVRVNISLFEMCKVPQQKENILGHEDIMETNVMTRSQGLAKENSLVLPKIKILQRNVKKFQTPKFTITSQDPR